MWHTKPESSALSDQIRRPAPKMRLVKLRPALLARLQPCLALSSMIPLLQRHALPPLLRVQTPTLWNSSVSVSVRDSSAPLLSDSMDRDQC